MFNRLCPIPLKHTCSYDMQHTCYRQDLLGIEPHTAIDNSCIQTLLGKFDNCSRVKPNWTVYTSKPDTETIPIRIRAQIKIINFPFSKTRNRFVTSRNLSVKARVSKKGFFDTCKGVHGSSLHVVFPGYQVLSDILFRLGLKANALTQCSA